MKRLLIIPAAFRNFVYKYLHNDQNYDNMYDVLFLQDVVWGYRSDS